MIQRAGNPFSLGAKSCAVNLTALTRMRLGQVQPTVGRSLLAASALGWSTALRAERTGDVQAMTAESRGRPRECASSSWGLDGAILRKA